MKPVVGIFAHPDDEVFGPGGTMAKFAREGRDVYLICVTDGDAGINSSGIDRDLGEIRKEELLASAEILGFKKVFFLGYKDGSLNNNLYHEVAEKITTILVDLQPELLITFEPRGVSGHIDHVAVSMITSFLFEKLSFVQEVWYYCITEAMRALYPSYFIYFPPGYKASEIEKVVDISSVWEQKEEATHKHASQKHDIETLLGVFLNQPKEEHFLLLTRNKE